MTIDYCLIKVMIILFQWCSFTQQKHFFIKICIQCVHVCDFYFLDLFGTPSGQMTPLHTTPAKVISPLKPKTARHQVALELLQTERNYVDILNTILKVCLLKFYSGIFPHKRRILLYLCIIGAINEILG